MLYYFKKGKNAAEMQKKKKKKENICAVYGEGTYDWSNVSKVVCRVSCWRFLAGWCPWLGRPAEVDSNRIKTLIKIDIIPRGR